MTHISSDTQKMTAQTPKELVKNYKWVISWRNVILFTYLHIFSLYGLYLGVVRAKWRTILWFLFIAVQCGFGTTAGAHRLWAHRAYKAKFLLRLYLAFWQTVSLQNHIYEWVRDHRVHHKFTDTDADPHNASRGFFFAHMGWLLLRKHDDVITKGKTVDMSDVEADLIVRCQKKFYVPLTIICCFIFPAVVPFYLWRENIVVAFHFASLFRYSMILHITWLVNSAAHFWGDKPYEKSIKPTDNKITGFITAGEGWHNYHHVFPWDYKAAELGNYRYNLTTLFLDTCARLGLAYDMKTVNLEAINKRVKRTGDGSREVDVSDVTLDDLKSKEEEHVWGWDDKNLKAEDKALVTIYHPESSQKLD